MEQFSQSFETLVKTVGEVFDPQLNDFFEPGETLKFQICAPAKPKGVLIYISPKPGAKLPEAWVQVLAERDLLWVGAENSGNEVHVARRVGLALLGLGLARERGVDGRAILSGFSGGGRVASMMMPAYPHLFSGAVFICGANPMFTATPEAIEILQQVPLVFLTGTGDFNLEDTQMAITTYQHAELPAHLMVVDGLGHALPEASDLDAALAIATTNI